MSVTGERDGEPTKAGVALLDVITGLYAAVGVLAALRERDVTGHGRHVSVSLFDASVAAMVNQAANYLIGGVVPRADGDAAPRTSSRTSRSTRADRPFILAAGNDRLFARTCDVVGHPDGDRRAVRHERVTRAQPRDARAAAEDVFATRTAAAWLEALEAASVPCAPIRSMDEVFASPEGFAVVEQVVDPSAGLLRLVANPIRFDGDTLPTPRPPPTLGEHTDEVLGG